MTSLHSRVILCLFLLSSSTHAMEKHQDNPIVPSTTDTRLAEIPKAALAIALCLIAQQELQARSAAQHKQEGTAAAAPNNNPINEKLRSNLLFHH